MAHHSRHTIRSNWTTVSIAASFCLVAPIAEAQEDNIALNAQPTRLISFETANMYKEGTLEFTLGTAQTESAGRNGTGNQTYFGGGAYAISDRVTVGFDVNSYRDPVLDPILGLFPDMRMETVGLWGKFGIAERGPLKFAALTSVESLYILDSPLWGGSNRNVVIGSIKAPISYDASPDLQFTFTPAVSVFPDTVSGAEFYGTIFSLGAGVSYRASERLAFFGGVDVPVSGNNTIKDDATYGQTPVWTVGGRYNFTPKGAVELFATNGVGMTPATSILTHWPDGDRVLLGARLVYTPGAKRPESYRGVPNPVTRRQQSLQLDGFTLGSADVLEPGHMSVSGWYGTDNGGGVALSFSPDRDGEFQVILEDFAEGTQSDPSILPKTDLRYAFGPKLRFLDQNNGNAYTLTGRALFGRRMQGGTSFGVFFAELIAGYKANATLSFTASAKAAAVANSEIVGLGLGVNYALTDKLSLIGEVTPVGLDASETTWAAGLRYDIAGSGFVMDLQGTNAIGRYGIGGMLAQEDPRFALTFTKVFDLRGAKFY